MKSTKKANIDIKKTDKVEIILKEKDCNKPSFFKNINMNISLHNLSFYNIRILEKALDVCVNGVDKDLSHLYAPIKKLRNSIRKLIKRVTNVPYNKIL